MTIKRINSTGRKRILREDARITLIADSGKPCCFKVLLNLDNYGLPEEARVFIEAYRKSSLMRFPYGTVGKLGSEDALELTEFLNPEGVLFRIKVVAVDEQKGMLLAEGEIPVAGDHEQPENRVALLPPRGEDLGNELWRIDFSNSPVLLVNNKLPDWKASVRTDVFRATVFPAAIRQVLQHILWSEDRPQLDDESEWPYNWLRFAERLSGQAHPPVKDHDQDWFDWVDDVCESFAKRFNLLTTYAEAMGET